MAATLMPEVCVMLCDANPSHLGGLRLRCEHHQLFAVMSNSRAGPIHKGSRLKRTTFVENVERTLWM